MDGADRAALSSLPAVLSARPLSGPGTVTLDAESAHHLRVRRLATGSRLRITDGVGVLGAATLVGLGKNDATVEVGELLRVPPPAPVRLLVPVADRDRMLWLAEKATELGLRQWTPVYWHRSRSVSPRGEGDAFLGRVRARMESALLQSGGAWLPELERERDARSLVESLAARGNDMRLLLHVGGAAFLTTTAGLGEGREVIVALGPEGGLQADEVELLESAGFARCSLGDGILRFETAAMASLALLGALRSARVG